MTQYPLRRTWMGNLAGQQGISRHFSSVEVFAEFCGAQASYKEMWSARGRCFNESYPKSQYSSCNSNNIGIISRVPTKNMSSTNSACSGKSKCGLLSGIYSSYMYLPIQRQFVNNGLHLLWTTLVNNIADILPLTDKTSLKIKWRSNSHGERRRVCLLFICKYDGNCPFSIYSSALSPSLLFLFIAAIFKRWIFM